MTTEQTAPAAPRPTRSDVPVLEARNISKIFGRVIAIKDVSLSVKADRLSSMQSPTRSATVSRNSTLMDA